jgi:uncharacterized protein
MKKNTERLIQLAESLLLRLDAVLPAAAPEPDWSALAWRWQVRNGVGFLQNVAHPHQIALEDICNVDEQKAEIVRNTAQFVAGVPANHVLLTGARGTGKSSLIKAVFTKFANQGLRLIEVDKQDLVGLADIVRLVQDRPERFIIFCDDLSFEADEPSYKALKVALDGSISANSDNVLVYASSNRKHLMPEFMAENLQTQYVGEEVRPADSVEEKISLSERFGLCLTFYAFDQDEYLAVAKRWLAHYGISGRVAYQFARDYAGKLQLARNPKSSKK